MGFLGSHLSWLEEGMAVCSSVLSWRIPRAETEEPWGAFLHKVAESDMTEQ